MHTLLQPFAIAFALDHGVPAKSHPLLAAKPVRLRSRVYSAPTIPLGLSKLAARPDSPLFTIRWSPKSSLRQSAPFPSQTNNHVTASLGPPPLSYEPLSARCRPQIPLRLAEHHQTGLSVTRDVIRTRVRYLQANLVLPSTSSPRTSERGRGYPPPGYFLITFENDVEGGVIVVHAI